MRRGEMSDAVHVDHQMAPVSDPDAGRASGEVGGVVIDNIMGLPTI